MLQTMMSDEILDAVKNTVPLVMEDGDRIFAEAQDRVPSARHESSERAVETVIGRLLSRCDAYIANPRHRTPAAAPTSFEVAVLQATAMRATAWPASRMHEASAWHLAISFFLLSPGGHGEAAASA